MSTATQGRAVEYAARDGLRAAGYDVVRAAASKGPCDLIAVGDDEVVLVNVKRTSPPGPAERRQLLHVAARIPAYAQPVIALGPASRVTYRLLTGPGAHDWREWHPTSKGDQK